jgi:hypothetical protein
MSSSRGLSDRRRVSGSRRIHGELPPVSDRSCHSHSHIRLLIRRWLPHFEKEVLHASRTEEHNSLTHARPDIPARVNNIGGDMDRLSSFHLAVLAINDHLEHAGHYVDGFRYAMVPMARQAPTRRRVVNK